MSGYVVACYSITVATLSAYALWTIRRYRAVVKRG